VDLETVFKEKTYGLRTDLFTAAALRETKTKKKNETYKSEGNGVAQTRR